MFLAVLMFPLAQQFGQWVQELYPYSEEVRQQIAGLESTLKDAPNWWMPFLLIAVLPSFCEELAFRGFVLSGLRHMGHKWWAIAISAIAFGMAHFILQQKISAAAVGLVIGFLAVQTGSLAPCIIFHALFNGLTLAAAQFAPSIDAAVKKYPVLEYIVRTDGQGIFQPAAMIACLMGTAGLLWWLHQLPYRRTEEEQLQEALDHQQLAGA
jgi:sodium transport system permease protein